MKCIWFRWLLQYKTSLLNEHILNSYPVTPHSLSIQLFWYFVQHSAVILPYTASIKQIDTVKTAMEFDLQMYFGAICYIATVPWQSATSRVPPAVPASHIVTSSIHVVGHPPETRLFFYVNNHTPYFLVRINFFQVHKILSDKTIVL